MDVLKGGVVMNDLLNYVNLGGGRFTADRRQEGKRVCCYKRAVYSEIKWSV